MGNLQPSGNSASSASSSQSNGNIIDLTMSISSSKESTPLSSLPSADTSLVDSGTSNSAMQPPQPGRWSDDELKKMAELVLVQWEIHKDSDDYVSGNKLFTLISKQMAEAGCYRSMDGCRNQWYSVISKLPEFQNTFSFGSKSFESTPAMARKPGKLATRVRIEKAGDHDENSVKHGQQQWTTEEADKLFELVKARLDLEKADPKMEKLNKPKLFELVSEQLRTLHSYDRTAGACKRYWNRHGEQRMGFKIVFDQDATEFDDGTAEPDESEDDVNDHSALPTRLGGRAWTDDEYEKLLQIIKDHDELELKDKSVEQLKRKEMFALFSKQLLDLHQIERTGRSCEAFWQSKGYQRSGCLHPRKWKLDKTLAGSVHSAPQSKARSSDSKKRAPLRFTDEERNFLKGEARKNATPSAERREQIAAELGIETKRVTGFFGNWRSGNYPEARMTSRTNDLTDDSDDDILETSSTSTRARNSTRRFSDTSDKDIGDSTPSESTPSLYGTRSSARKRNSDEVDRVIASVTPASVYETQNAESSRENTISATVASGSPSKNLSNLDGDHGRKRPRTEEQVAGSSHLQASPRPPKKQASFHKSPVPSSKLAREATQPGDLKKWVKETEAQLSWVKTDLERLEANITNCNRSLKDDTRRLLAIEKEAGEIRERMKAKEKMIEESNDLIQKLRPSQETLEKVLSLHDLSGYRE